MRVRAVISILRKIWSYIKQYGPFVLLVATFIGAAFLRFYRLDGQSLWSDEGNSVALTRHSFADIAQRTAFDIHPPLYYWLLKLWTIPFGDSEIAVRSLSAVLGVGLVILTWRLGTRLFNQQIGGGAALLAAISPFQIYYAQEARMYMLLTVLATLTVLAVVELVESPGWGWRGVFVGCVVAGLYTHYAYPVILVAVNGWLLLWLRDRRLLEFIGMQAIAGLCYLPWVPTAWRQLTTWPSEPHTAAFSEIVGNVTTTLFFGLTWPVESNLWILVCLGVVAWLVFRADIKAASLLGLWLLIPMLLTMVIYSPAFLKFLLVASPALCVLGASLIIKQPNPLQDVAGKAVLAAWMIGAAISGYQYYYNPTFARDDYRGIVAFIEAVSGPNDAIILHAEGQQDIFNYYYDGSLPVHPLPRQRPLDESATLAELESIAAESETVYAVYWATQQADSAGLIESWLDTTLFKATDQWYGNVRLVTYASLSTESNFQPLDAQFNDTPIRLTGYALHPQTVTPGDILAVSLRWDIAQPLNDAYTVFLQVLDSNNHVVGQRDAPLMDSHGLFIEPGTPPGTYRLIGGLYHSQTGQRLQVNGRDFVTISPIEIVKPLSFLPLGAYKIQNMANADMGTLQLVGYDVYKLGHRSEPETPIGPGEPFQVVAYWTRTGAATSNELGLQIVTGTGDILKNETRPLAGIDYAVSLWDSGEIVRAQYTLFAPNFQPSETYRLNFVYEDAVVTTRSLPVFTPVGDNN